MKPIFESGPLITACKFEAAGTAVIDVLTRLVPIMVTRAVQQEVVLAGARYPDAAIAKQRIDTGQITVEAAPAAPDLSTIIGFYGLGPGETESILLAAHRQKIDPSTLIVVDDLRAYIVCDRLAIQKALFLDFTVSLVDSGKFSAGEAMDIVQVVRSRYPSAFVDHTLHVLSRR